jgi:dihydrofolate synthase / folylpolyglutamate synthase
MPLRPDPTRDGASHPGEPGIGPDLAPPFAPDCETTRWLFDLNRLGIRPGLRRIRGLLDELGRPERGMISLVVAGTNGKGSTTRLLARLLQEAGHRTACYTSPHLLSMYERLEIDGAPVGREHFRGLVEGLRPAVERHEASWFETLTAAALAAARDRGVEVFCCEAGLGGRLDASNALPAAAILLTGVSLDHQAILGDTVEAIAAEKLGLLKPGVPLFCAVAEGLKSQVFAAAVAAGCPAHFLDELTRCEVAADGWELATRRALYRGLPPCAAPAMRRNAALALLALEELAAAGVVRPASDPVGAVSRTFLPGRFQVVLRDPDWILDTAHNAEALAVSLEAFLARPCAGRRLVLFGGMLDKDPGDDAGRLLARMDRIVLAPVSLPRSRNPEQLKSLMDRWGLAAHHGAVVLDGVAAAIDDLAGAARGDAVLVCGSCFLVAEVLHELGYRSLDETRSPREAGAALAARTEGRT